MKRSIILLFLFFSTLLSSCANSVNKINLAALDTETKTISQWEITILNSEITEDLSGTQSVVQYSGDTVDVEFNEKPADGYVFVLLKMQVEKTQTGQGKFSWSNAYLQDADGNQYFRHENDTFLTNFNLPRIKSTDLVFGKSEGFACFEIPVKASKGELTFVYEDGGETVEITLQ